MQLGEDAKTKQYNERCSYQLCHSGNYKGFRNSVPGNGAKHQIYIYFSSYHNITVKKNKIPIYLKKKLGKGMTRLYIVTCFFNFHVE